MAASPTEPATPSTIATVAAAAIISGLAGYFIGQGQSIGLFGGSSGSSSSHKSPRRTFHPTARDDSDSDLSDGVEDLTDLKAVLGDSEECKLVLVVRTDLGMTKGKIGAQCGHATLACYKALLRADPAHPTLQRWERQGQAKVALKVDSEEDMLTLQAQAVSLGLCARVIHDAGRTQIASGSATVLGIGPGPKSIVDQVTGHLKLL